MPHGLQAPLQVVMDTNFDLAKIKDLFIGLSGFSITRQCRRRQAKYVTDYRKEYQHVCDAHQEPSCHTTYEKKCDFKVVNYSMMARTKRKLFAVI